MKIVVAGGSGFLGRRLVRSWRADGHLVKVLTRRPRNADDVQWAPGVAGAGEEAWASEIGQAAAVVNLAGEGIADRRWTAERKAAILGSRIAATRAIADAIRGASTPAPLLINASGIGYYGTRGNVVTEEAPPDNDFLAVVCQRWEAEAMKAAAVSRVVLLRTGLVLARDGGALPKMALPFQFFAGGRVGSGRQPMSWIHVDDWVEMVRWALSNAAVSGPLNVTAPAPVTNTAFTRALARAMRRPALLPTPAFVLRTVLGREMADSLLLGGQRALPVKAERLGFQFKFRDVETALRDLYH